MTPRVKGYTAIAMAAEHGMNGMTEAAVILMNAAMRFGCVSLGDTV